MDKKNYKEKILVYIGENMPKISILIPIYNVEKYLQDCLESVIHQTERDIEIICVDDASVDGSLKILQEYVNRDNRLKLLKHTENKGLCKTRKDAVEVATGKYILFLDSDDYLSLDTCEKLFAFMETGKYDFLQFGANIIPEGNVSDDMIQWVDNFMNPEEIKDITGDILRACFIEHKFNCNLVNKIWRNDLCKKGFSKIKDGNYVSAEDRYALFILSYYANSVGLVNDKFYHYRLGVGVTGGEILDVVRFESRCKGAEIVKNVEEFVGAQNEIDKYEDVLQEYKRDILLDCIDCWMNKLSESTQRDGWKKLLRYWGTKEVISTIAGRYFDEQERVLKCSKIDKNRCVALYYRSIGDKYSERILLKYVDYLKATDYRVVLITDKDAIVTGQVYLNCQLKYIFPATDANWSMYEKRCVEWIELIKSENIETVYYFSPTSHMVRLDELTIRALNSQFIICMDEYKWIKIISCIKGKLKIFKNKLKLLKRNK